MPDPDRTADYDKHTEAELRKAVDKARREDPRIAEEGSSEALEAERRQRAAMEEELREREQ